MDLLTRSRSSVPLLLTALLGCLGKPDPNLDSRIEALEDSLAILTEAVAATVDLKPGDASFSVLRLDVGSLALNLDSVTPYGQGSLLGFSIANLTSAEIDGLAGTLWWGIPEADGTHPVDERRSHGLILSQPLPAGAWVDVMVSLESVPPQQIGFVRLSQVSATSIRVP